MIARVTGDELRAAMRRFPAPIAVVTADYEGDRIGLTVGSLVSVSLEPPLVAVSLGRGQAAHELVRGARAFAVSLLSGDQEGLARRFAQGMPPLALWQGVAARESDTGPLLEDALAWLQCRLWGSYDAGDHTLFVGEVLVAELGVDGDGLVYRNGTYHRV
jgi:flavin reductase (DIM6/NTAB) family NADH-FMN oxidoreductase RutF